MIEPKGIRIAKILARAGVCSRREAERLIAQGRVSVDGRRLDTPAMTTSFEADIRVDGVAIKPPQPTRLWLYHKPRGELTTHHDPAGRASVFASLPQSLPRVIAVGRLDYNSEGLLLLTNDGSFAASLAHPRSALPRCYRLRLRGVLTPAICAAIESGPTIDGIRYRPIEVITENMKATHVWMTMILREGKNREIRRIMEHFDLTVARLIRTGYGPLELGKLPSRGLREIEDPVALFAPLLPRDSGEAATIATED